jgi:hypothetical protein
MSGRMVIGLAAQVQRGTMGVETNDDWKTAGQGIQSVGS